MIVLDSAAGVDYLLRFEPLASWVEAAIEDAGAALHAPHVFDVEVLGVVRRLALRGDLVEPRAERALTELRMLPMVRYPHLHLLERIWELRHVVAMPDAAFVALAEALDAPLVTTDARLARSHGHRAAILAP